MWNVPAKKGWEKKKRGRRGFNRRNTVLVERTGKILQGCFVKFYWSPCSSNLLCAVGGKFPSNRSAHQVLTRSSMTWHSGSRPYLADLQYTLPCCSGKYFCPFLWSVGLLLPLVHTQITSLLSQLGN